MAIVENTRKAQLKAFHLQKKTMDSVERCRAETIDTCCYTK